MARLPQAAAAAFNRARTVTYEAGEALEAYQAVAIDAGAAVAAGDGDHALGVVAKDADAGDNVTVAVDGAVPAFVADAVVAGEQLGSSAEAGELAAGDGHFTALTDAGDAAGLSHGGDFGAGIAMVNIH
ncbi:hypothetical protein [Natronorarus salvus]|uniref:hypothetical protein n=1 Tax=Natronorarus salvus TaxID=3117733 RepID=UPI002F267C2C